MERLVELAQWLRIALHKCGPPSASCHMLVLTCTYICMHGQVRLEQLEQRNLFLEQQLAQHHGLNQSALAAQTHLHVPFMRSPPRRDASLIEQQARDLADAYKNNDFLRFQVEKQGRKT